LAAITCATVFPRCDRPQRNHADLLIDTLWKNVPAEKEKAQDVPSVSVQVQDLLPSERGYFTFVGSLTTPPCSAGVTWYVLKSHTTISPERPQLKGVLEVELERLRLRTRLTTGSLVFKVEREEVLASVSRGVFPQMGPLALTDRVKFRFFLPPQELLYLHQSRVPLGTRLPAMPVPGSKRRYDIFWGWGGRGGYRALGSQNFLGLKRKSEAKSSSCALYRRMLRKADYAIAPLAEAVGR
jgi:hypothetical protein